jgi:hypothetical protein
MFRKSRLAAIISGALTAAGVVAGMAIVAPATASAAPNFQLPFQCNDKWRLNTWDSGHAPALDMVHEPQSNTEGQLLIAPAAGTVNQSFYHSNAGNVIQINHGGGHFTTYIHLQSRAVAAGARVSQGQTIGRVGHTGPTSNGVPHLHYEQGFDSNGDGSASWGFAGAERVTARFNGVNYGPGAGGEWRNVVSRNCGGGGGSSDDVTGDGLPDLVGRTASGDLLLYPHSGSVNGESTWRSSTKVSHGWGGMTTVLLGDVTGEGRSDLIGRTANGDLLLYPHSGTVNGEATWWNPTKVGHGWDGMTNILLDDVTGDGKGDLVGQTANGDLLLYPNSGTVNGESTFYNPTKVSHGWGGMTSVLLGDATGDGRPDLIGRTANGDLLLYPHSGSVNGESTWYNPTKVGHGWDGMTAILLADVTGDGTSDLIGRTANGDLLLYPHSGTVNGESTFYNPTKVSHGWDGMTAVLL